MKYEWKKNEKELYGTKKQPILIKVPKQKFIMISGKGNPNGVDFSDKVGALYSLAYGIKMRYKKNYKNNDSENKGFKYDDFVVFPLEGVWTSSGDPLDKESFEYNIMIKQPDVITEMDFKESLEIVQKKKPNPLLKDINFNSLESGLCVQMLHVGTFDDEPATFALMDKYLDENNLKRSNEFHREIYLTNANRTHPSKYKTILRYQVRKL